MKQLILASHSVLAEAMKETAEFFGAENIVTIQQTAEDTGFEQRAEELLEKYKGCNPVVITDFYGGSVNQTFARKLLNHSFHLISGMNLSLVLEIAFEEDVDEQFIRQAVELSKTQVSYMNDLLSAMANDSDDDDD